MAGPMLVEKKENFRAEAAQKSREMSDLRNRAETVILPQTTIDELRKGAEQLLASKDERLRWYGTQANAALGRNDAAMALSITIIACVEANGYLSKDGMKYAEAVISGKADANTLAAFNNELSRATLVYQIIALGDEIAEMKKQSASLDASQRKFAELRTNALEDQWNVLKGLAIKSKDMQELSEARGKTGSILDDYAKLLCDIDNERKIQALCAIIPQEIELNDQYMNMIKINGMLAESAMRSLTRSSEVFREAMERVQQGIGSDEASFAVAALLERAVDLKTEAIVTYAPLSKLSMLPRNEKEAMYRAYGEEHKAVLRDDMLFGTATLSQNAAEKLKRDLTGFSFVELSVFSLPQSQEFARTQEAIRTAVKNGDLAGAQEILNKAGVKAQTQALIAQAIGYVTGFAVAFVPEVGPWAATAIFTTMSAQNAMNEYRRNGRVSAGAWAMLGLSVIPGLGTIKGLQAVTALAAIGGLGWGGYSTYQLWDMYAKSTDKYEKQVYLQSAVFQSCMMLVPLAIGSPALLKGAKTMVPEGLARVQQTIGNVIDDIITTPSRTERGAYAAKILLSPEAMDLQFRPQIKGGELMNKLLSKAGLQRVPKAEKAGKAPKVRVGGAVVTLDEEATTNVRISLDNMAQQNPARIVELMGIVYDRAMRAPSQATARQTYGHILLNLYRNPKVRQALMQSDSEIAGIMRAKILNALDTEIKQAYGVKAVSDEMRAGYLNSLPGLGSGHIYMISEAIEAAAGYGKPLESTQRFLEITGKNEPVRREVTAPARQRNGEEPFQHEQRMDVLKQWIDNSRQGVDRRNTDLATAKVEALSVVEGLPAKDRVTIYLQERLRMKIDDHMAGMPEEPATVVTEGQRGGRLDNMLLGELRSAKMKELIGTTLGKDKMEIYGNAVNEGTIAEVSSRLADRGMQNISKLIEKARAGGVLDDALYSIRVLGDTRKDVMLASEARIAEDLFAGREFGLVQGTTDFFRSIKPKKIGMGLLTLVPPVKGGLKFSVETLKQRSFEQTWGTAIRAGVSQWSKAGIIGGTILTGFEFYQLEPWWNLPGPRLINAFRDAKSVTDGNRIATQLIYPKRNEHDPVHKTEVLLEDANARWLAKNADAQKVFMGTRVFVKGIQIPNEVEMAKIMASGGAVALNPDKLNDYVTNLRKLAGGLNAVNAALAKKDNEALVKELTKIGLTEADAVKERQLQLYFLRVAGITLTEDEKKLTLPEQDRIIEQKKKEIGDQIKAETKGMDARGALSSYLKTLDRESLDLLDLNSLSAKGWLTRGFMTDAKMYVISTYLNDVRLGSAWPKLSGDNLTAKLDEARTFFYNNAGAFQEIWDASYEGRISALQLPAVMKAVMGGMAVETAIEGNGMAVPIVKNSVLHALDQRAWENNDPTLLTVPMETVDKSGRKTTTLRPLNEAELTLLNGFAINDTEDIYGDVRTHLPQILSGELTVELARQKGIVGPAEYANKADHSMYTKGSEGFVLLLKSKPKLDLWVKANRGEISNLKAIAQDLMRTPELLGESDAKLQANAMNNVKSYRKNEWFGAPGGPNLAYPGRAWKEDEATVKLVRDGDTYAIGLTGDAETFWTAAPDTDAGKFVALSNRIITGLCTGQGDPTSASLVQAALKEKYNGDQGSMTADIQNKIYGIIKSAAAAQQKEAAARTDAEKMDLQTINAWGISVSSDSGGTPTAKVMTTSALSNGLISYIVTITR